MSLAVSRSDGPLAGLRRPLAEIFLVFALLGGLVSALGAAPPAGAAGNTADHDEHMMTLPRTAGIAPESGGEPVVYSRFEGVVGRGRLHVPERPLPGRPGVVVIHEWWGRNDWVEAQAARFAAAGFHALTVDLYRGQVASTPERARELMTQARGREEWALGSLADAALYLESEVDCGAVGVIGWCMGGGYSLDVSLAHPELIDATVLYYGFVRTDPQELRPLQAPLLAIFGGRDQGIPLSTVHTFGAALRKLGKDHAIKVFPEAGHAFANPNRLSSHRPRDAAAASRLTLEFFREFLVP